MSGRLKVLWVATKFPNPPVDGGRVAMLRTLEALHDSCVQDLSIHFIAPQDPTDRAMPEKFEAAGWAFHQIPVVRRSRVHDGLKALLKKQSGSLARHNHQAITHAITAAIQTFRPDVIHVEQLQAWAPAQRALGAQLPTVLRMQNKESDLFAQRAQHARGVSRWLLEREARLVQAAETTAIARASRTLAITQRDQEALLSSCPPGKRGDVLTLRAPIAAHASLDTVEPSALVLFGSSGWAPNQDAETHFLQHIWPRLSSDERMLLNVYSPEHESWQAQLGQPHGVQFAPPPPCVDTVFTPGSVLVVPLRIASGVRIKILEAWARGVPVIASRIAAEGLEATPGEELLIADTQQEYQSALQALRDPICVNRLRHAGQAALRRNHDPGVIANQLHEIWSSSAIGH